LAERKVEKGTRTTKIAQKMKVKKKIPPADIKIRLCAD